MMNLLNTLKIIIAIVTFICAVVMLKKGNYPAVYGFGLALTWMIPDLFQQ